jgi:hypothetical protein
MSNIDPKITAMADLIRDEVITGINQSFDNESFPKSLEGAKVTFQQVLDVQEHVKLHSDAWWLVGGMHMVDTVIRDSPGAACEYATQLEVGSVPSIRILGQDYDDGENLDDGPIVTFDMVEIPDETYAIDPEVHEAVMGTHFDREFDRVHADLIADSDIPMPGE